jgi:multidrug resistance efflux pump
MIAKRSEVEIAEFELTRRKVTAPATGFVEARIAQLGEWVQPGSPIATVIQMDRLRIEGDIDALRYPRAVRQGTAVEVSIYSETDKAIKVQGKLGFVSMEIDLNNRYRVWVEVENQKVGSDWLIKPGMRAEIVIRKAAELF